jgi:hypothetical protein
MSEAVRIERLEDVRPGDFMFGPIGGWVGLGVAAGELLCDGGFRVGPLDVRHVGIVVEASRQEPPSPEWTTGVITAPRLVQAMPGGAEEIEMRYSTHWTPRHAYARLVEDYPGQALDAAAIARLMVQHNVAYSPASYPALAAWHWGLSTPKLEAWIGRRQPVVPIEWPSERQDTVTGHLGVALPVEAICSVLGDQSWTLTGKKIMTGVPHQCVTPSALATRLMFSAPELVQAWGFAAEHPYP